MADSPLSRGRPGIERPGRHDGRSAGRRGVRRRRLGGGRLRPRPSGPAADRRVSARADGPGDRPGARRAGGDHRRCAGDHGPGRRGAGAGVAADAADRRYDARAVRYGNRARPSGSRASPRSRRRCTRGSVARGSPSGPAEIEVRLPGPAPRPRGPREPGYPPPGRGARRVRARRRPRSLGPGRRSGRLAGAVRRPRRD